MIWLALILSVLRLTAAAAQVAGDQAAKSLPSPVPVTLTVRIADGRGQFRPGEIIPIELEFDSRIPKRFAVDGATYDRGGRLTIDEFLIEPNDAVTDPLLDYFASSGGFIGGGIRGTGVLGDKPFTVRLELNAWFRFDKAGTYTLSVRSQRVSDETKATTSTQAVVPVTSNTVSFEILPHDSDWEATELAAAVRTLDANGFTVDRENACRILRFLGTEAAVDAILARYDRQPSDCDFDYMAGLFSAPDRERVVRRLEAGLRAIDRPVSQSYLRTLSVLSVYVQHPELRAPQTRDTKGRLILSSDLARLQDLVQVATAAYTDILDAALPEKSPRARAAILSWRLASALSTDRLSAAPTASTDRLREQLTATFLDLPADRQASLLGYQWRSLAGPAMAPVLRALVDAPAPPSSPLPDLALRRLYEVAPDEGRARILREIRNPSSGASLKTLGLLPDRELPELDAVLATNVESSDGSDGRSIHEELLHRYASPAVSARVLSHVDGLLTRMACRPQAALLAYFVRVNPDLGNTLLDRALAWRATTGCYTMTLREVAKLRMTPGVEAAAVAHLDDPDPQVGIDAANTLGQYGSGAAAQPLRAQFERWHRAWQGRQEELRYSQVVDRPNAVQGMIEGTLLHALGQGQGWLTDEAGLRELRALCVTDSCRARADSMIGSAGETRIIVARVTDPDDSTIMLAQYQLDSIAALEQKLAQYPRGTSFTVDVTALDPQMARDIVPKLTTFAETHGLAIRP